MDLLIHKDFNKDELPANFINQLIIPPFPYLEYTLPENICDSIIASVNTFSNEDKYDVGVNGLPDNDYGVGSNRVTTYDTNFAKYLSEELSPHIPNLLSLNDYYPVDWQSQNEGQYNVWAYEGISPVFRFMTYRKGGEHFPHYDAPYLLPEDPYTRTLMSGVIYLTNNKSGATGFIEDSQNNLKFTERSTADWNRQATKEEVISWSLPQKGKIIIFPHQTCHNVFPLLEDEERIIIRFDIFYTALRRD